MLLFTVRGLLDVKEIDATIDDELGRRSQLYSLLMPVMNKFESGLDKGEGMYILFINPKLKPLEGWLQDPF